MAQTITCLFCFQDFPAQNLHFRCKNPNCRGNQATSGAAELDTTFAEYRKLPPSPMGHSFLSGGGGLFGRSASSAKCNLCSQESYYPLCPKCHFELPHDITQIEQHIIAIIGGRGTGKSHYIAALVNSLQREVGANFKIAVQMIGDETRKRWKDGYYTSLYEQNRELNQTDSATVAGSKVKEPMIFRLTFMEEGSKKNKRAINLVCFDTAGEDMAAGDIMDQQTLYISHAVGLVFLLDPLQMRAVRAKGGLDQWTLQKNQITSDPEEIIGRLCELFSKKKQLVKDQVPIHVAFALSKIDALYPLMEPDSALHHSGHHFGELNLGDVLTVDSELKDLLADWISPGFCTTITSRFASSRYFGVSALGATPAPDGSIKPNSLRVEDPFLWILYQLGMIKAKKR
jgi:GTPase SAR1 family protein